MLFDVLMSKYNGIKIISVKNHRTVTYGVIKYFVKNFGPNLNIRTLLLSSYLHGVEDK